MRFRLRLLPLTVACAAAFVLAGCVSATGASFGASIVVFVIALLGLGVAACSDTNQTPNNGWDVGEALDASDASDGSTPSDADDVVEPPDVEDTGHEEEGTWGPCCDNGEISSCYCPPRTACNYGWYTDCGDGTCSMDPDGCGDTGDAGDTSDTSDVADAADTSDAADANDAQDASDTTDVGDTVDAETDPGGSWSTCCKNGQIDSCYCPAGMACNYGWYEDCGGGTCTYPGGTCPDAGGDTGVDSSDT